MRRNFKKITALFASIAIMFTMLAPTVAFAYDANLYTELPGESTVKFRKDLALENDANIPAATFNYTITTGTYVAADTANDTIEVLAGVGTPTITTVTYTAGDTVLATTPYLDGPNSTDYKLATQYATIDFGSVTFKEPGVYRYIITESGTNQGITNDVEYKDGEFSAKTAAGVRTLDVYVGDDSDDSGYKLKIENYVLYEGTVTGAPKAGNPGTVDKLDANNNITADNPNGGEVTGATKSEGYINSYDSSNISFGKRVKGNQGSKDKYFKFTVNITGAQPDTVYDVVLDNAVVTVTDTDATKDEYVGEINTDKITVGADGTISTVFYLQHGQSITIKGLAKDTKYTITEDKEDYDAEYGGDFADTTDTASGAVTATGLDNLKNYIVDGINIPRHSRGFCICALKACLLAAS